MSFLLLVIVLPASVVILFGRFLTPNTVFKAVVTAFALSFHQLEMESFADIAEVY